MYFQGMFRIQALQFMRRLVISFPYLSLFQTYVGDILIAVNPFKDLGIYTKEVRIQIFVMKIIGPIYFILLSVSVKIWSMHPQLLELKMPCFSSSHEAIFT